MASLPYLSATFGPLVAHICEGDADFEVDPAFLGGGAPPPSPRGEGSLSELEANVDNIAKAVQWFIDSAIHSASACPRLLRSIHRSVWG